HPPQHLVAFYFRIVPVERVVRTIAVYVNKRRHVGGDGQCRPSVAFGMRVAFGRPLKNIFWRIIYGTVSIVNMVAYFNNIHLPYERPFSASSDVQVAVYIQGAGPEIVAGLPVCLR